MADRVGHYSSPLPNPAMLQALEREMAIHKLIRRRFVFGYADGNPIDLLIGAMAWGYGTDNRRGSKNARATLTAGDPPDRVIGAVRNALATQSTSAGFSAMFADRKPRLPRLNVAFVTKVLHFVGYETTARPRPLIYDQRVARALARMPDAPYIPHTADSSGISGDQYERYCAWSEEYARHHHTEPVVVEYALFDVGGKMG